MKNLLKLFIVGMVLVMGGGEAFAVVSVAETGGTDAGTFLETWTPMVNGDTGTALTRPSLADRTAQVTGTFGVGGTIVIQGSLDNSNWFTLTDPQGNPISFTAAGGKALTELVPYMRPNVTAGDGTTSLTARIFIRATTPQNR